MENNEREEHNNIYAYIQAQFQPLHHHEPKTQQIYNNAHIRKVVSGTTMSGGERCYFLARHATRTAPKAVKCRRIIFKGF